MQTILIIEDDKDLSEIIKGYLLRENYKVLCCANGDSGLTLVRNVKPDVVILDLMIPGLDGEEVCKIIRRECNIPIIIISAKSSEADKLLLLGLGADDYLIKPFSMKELTARVNAQVRRLKMYQSSASGFREYKGLKIYPEHFIVNFNNEEISLTAKEFKLLDFLSENSGKVYTKQQLLDAVWGYDEYINDNTVTVSIARLREKLSAFNINAIKTVWGVGYKWEI